MLRPPDLAGHRLAEKFRERLDVTPARHVSRAGVLCFGA